MEMVSGFYVLSAQEANSAGDSALPGGKSVADKGGEEVIKLDSVPQEFELWVDRLGFHWQLTKEGALQSGSSSYYQSAMALQISGNTFSGVKGKRIKSTRSGEEAEARIVLEGEANGVRVNRDVWFDHRRGGVRYIDSFSNEKGKDAVRLSVQLKTMFRATWQDLHGSSGKILGGRGTTSLGSRDHGVLVRYSRTDGRPDTVLIAAGDGDVMKPRISYSSNHRELTFAYNLEIPAGKTVALVHWIMQRNLRSPGEVTEALRPFYLRRRLLQPRVPSDLAKVTVNFQEEAMPEYSVEPYSLESLIAFRKATQAYNAERLWEDVLWITGENQLAGVLNEKALLKIQTAFGESEVSAGEIAAIQGGGGVGRTPRVFLRDGRVLCGNVTAEGLTMTSRDGWDMELAVGDLMFLLTRLKEEDGKAPDGAGLFVALRSGDVLAVSEDIDVKLEVLSPWGSDQVSLADIASLRYASGEVPKYRLHRKDGSWMSVFLSGTELELKSVSTSNVRIKAGEISGIWRVSPEKLEFEDKYEGDDWLDFEDVGEMDSLPLPCCLLVGSNLLHGEIDMEVMHLVSGGAVTEINPGEILSMERVDEFDAVPVFDVELSGGNRLRGRLRERSLTMKTASRNWDIPVQHFIGYMRKEVK